MSPSETLPDTPLMRQYQELKAACPNAVLFFRLGDFYEMFGTDAEMAAPLLGLVLTARQEIPMCGLPQAPRSPGPALAGRDPLLRASDRNIESARNPRPQDLLDAGPGPSSPRRAAGLGAIPGLEQPYAGRARRPAVPRLRRADAIS